MATTYVFFVQSKGKAFSKRRKTRDLRRYSLQKTGKHQQMELQTRRKAEKKRCPQG